MIFILKIKKKKLKLYSLDLYFCNKCKLIQLADIVSPEKIYNQYLYKSQHSVGLVEHFRNYCETVIKKLKLILNYGFRTLNLNKLWAEIYEIDTKKLNFFEIKGFKIDATLREHYFNNGKYYSSHILSLLKKEYE